VNDATQTDENLRPLLTAQIKVLTPWAGNAPWFTAVCEKRAEIVETYDVWPVEAGSSYPHPDAVREVRRLHPGMDLVYLGAPYALD